MSEDAAHSPPLPAPLPEGLAVRLAAGGYSTRNWRVWNEAAGAGRVGRGRILWIILLFAALQSLACGAAVSFSRRAVSVACGAAVSLAGAIPCEALADA